MAYKVLHLIELLAISQISFLLLAHCAQLHGLVLTSGPQLHAIPFAWTSLF